MRYRRLLPILILCGMSAGARAAPATARGAHDIEQTYAAYLGHAVIDEGIVSVAPDGDSYVVTWNLQKAVELAAPPPGELDIGALTYRLTPGPGGAWTLKGEHFPKIAFEGRADKGQASGALDLGGFQVEGVYDPALSEFLRSTTSVETLQGAFQIEDSGQRSEFSLSEDGLTLEARVKPSAEGNGVDVALAQAFKAMRESISTPSPDEGGDPEQMTYALTSVVGGASFEGLRAREIGEVWTYLVAHADDSATPPELKTRIQSALPLWRDIDAHAQIHDLQFNMPQGSATLKTLAETLRLTGFTAKGSVQFGLEVEDMAVKSDLAPPWLDAFWPASVSLNLSGSSDGWDEAARIALQDPQFGDKGDLSPRTQDEIAATLAAGHPKLTIAPSHVKTPALDMTFEGEASAEAGAAAGHFKVTADSLDKTIALLVEIGKTEPDAQNAVFAVTFLKGLARTGDDGRLVWEVDVAGGGEVTVNGTPMPVGR